MKLCVTACVCCFVIVDYAHLKFLLILLYKNISSFLHNWLFHKYYLCLPVYDFRKHNILTLGIYIYEENTGKISESLTSKNNLYSGMKYSIKYICVYRFCKV